MLIYVLKSAACLAILHLFYKLFLEKENMHVFKRYYLLGSLVFALIVPTIVFTEYIEVAPIPYTSIPDTASIDLDTNIPAKPEADILYIAPLLWSIYFLGMLFFGIKFLKNLFQVFMRIRRNPKHRKPNFIQVLLREKIPPHTFFRYIFLNKSKFEANKIPTEVLLHEETHARERHSLDVVFIELLQVVFWINPLIYYYKKAIKLNHEFLADRAVLNKDIDAVAYQNTLLSFLSLESAKKYQPSLSNAINYPSIKKRFTIMKTKTSKRAIFLRSLLLLPIVASLLFGFSQKRILKTSPESPHSIIGNWIDEELELTVISIFEQDGNLMLDYGDSKANALRVEKINGEYHYFPNYIPPNSQTKYPLLFDGETGTLHFGKWKCIPEAKSLKRKLIGSWKNDKENIKFIVHPMGNGIVWDVIKADGERIRFRPIKYGDSYGFTYAKELWSFRVVDGVLLDSKGVTYQRIPEGEYQDGATKEQVAEYNALAQKYNEMMQQDDIRIMKSDVERLEYLHGLMSEEQRANAEPFPDFPEPPEPPEAPDVPEEIEIEKEIESPEPPNPPEPIEHEKEMERMEHELERQEHKLERQVHATEKQQVEMEEQARIMEEQSIEIERGAEHVKVQKAQMERQLQKKERQKRKLPPPPPPHKAPEEGKKYSEELIKAFDNYTEEGEVYAKKIMAYRKRGRGTISSLERKYEEVMELYNNYVKLAVEEGLMHPQKAESPKSKKGNKSSIPPPPPPPPAPEPKSPAEFAKEMEGQNAIFYYEGKEISSKKAIELLENSDEINLEAKHTGLKRPIVKLSDGPIHIKEDN